jgi:hypothetical protein
VTHEEQALPTLNDNPYIHDLVSADIQSRKELGTERYGTPLQADNGRDVLRDGYEEALDQTVYLRQAIEERSLKLEQLRARLAEIVEGAVLTNDVDPETTEAILDAMVRVTMPFVTNVNRPPVVRWHDASGETWEIEPGKLMQFPGGTGAFSLSFGEEKVQVMPLSAPNSFTPVAEAAWNALMEVTHYAGEANISQILKIMRPMDTDDLEYMIEAAELLREAAVKTRRAIVYGNIVHNRQAGE